MQGTNKQDVSSERGSGVCRNWCGPKIQAASGSVPYSAKTNRLREMLLLLRPSVFVSCFFRGQGRGGERILKQKKFSRSFPTKTVHLFFFLDKQRAAILSSNASLCTTPDLRSHPIHTHNAHLIHAHSHVFLNGSLVHSLGSHPVVWPFTQTGSKIVYSFTLTVVFTQPFTLSFAQPHSHLYPFTPTDNENNGISSVGAFFTLMRSDAASLFCASVLNVSGNRMRHAHRTHRCECPTW